jgi:hypothetical protein
MLVEELQPFIIAAPPGYERPANFYLTINKTTTNQWSAGYQDYTTLRVLLGINDCDDLGEVAVRLNARLNRYHRANAAKTHTLHNAPKGDTVRNTNVTEGPIMPDEQATPSTDTSNQDLTFGGKAVGVSFNPSGNPEVDDIKKAAANFIDAICGHSGEKLNFAQGKDNEAPAMRKLAERAAQEAQMWAVKAATWAPEKSQN